MTLTIRNLEKGDCRIIAQAFQAQGWNKPEAQYFSYYDEMINEKRDVLVALADNVFAGYLTIMWKTFYPPFREKNIPEIMDLNVLEKFQRRGIASRLLDEAESRIAERSDTAGIGVGLYKSYGTAQRLYIRRGYVPDGLGLSYNEVFPEYGETVKVDDDLIICFTKKLK